MKNSYSFIFLILLIFVIVKGEVIKSTKTIPDITTSIVSTNSIPPTKTTPDVVTKTIISIKTIPPTGVNKLPISAVGKKYCGIGLSYTVRYDDENFICYGYRRYDTSGCRYYYTDRYTYTSFTDDCYQGSEIEKGIYSPSIINNSKNCTDRYKHMETFTYEKESRWRRDLLYANGITDLSEFSTATSIDELPVDDIAKEYCRGYDNIYVYIGETGFACILQNNPEMGDGCLPPVPQPKYIYSSFNLDCINVNKGPSGLYYSEISDNGKCEDSLKVMNTNIFYLRDKSSKMLPSTKTPIYTKTVTTVPMTTESTTTVTEESTTTLTIESSTISTIESSTISTIPNTLPTKSPRPKYPPTTTTTTTTEFTETNPTEFSTIFTETIPTELVSSTITTTSTSSISTLPTKVITLTTTVTITQSVKCLPPQTVTVKETIKLKETVTVTVQNEPTNVVGKMNCVGKWGQCGGIGFKGPTCCKAGLKCKKLNQLYSHCI